MNFTQLTQEHSEIDHLVSELEQRADTGFRDHEQASHLLGALAKALGAHLSNEDVVFLSMIRADDHETRNAASNFILEFDLVRRDWNAFIKVWHEEAVATGWERFCEEAVEVLRRLRQRAREEDAVIYPLALQKGCIKLR